MILYHGTNNEIPILHGFMKKGTWLAKHRFHAFRIAERRAKQRGGEPIVIEIETNSFSRIEGRDNPTYLFTGEKYLPLAIHKIERNAFL